MKKIGIQQDRKIDVRNFLKLFKRSAKRANIYFMKFFDRKRKISSLIFIIYFLIFSAIERNFVKQENLNYVMYVGNGIKVNLINVKKKQLSPQILCIGEMYRKRLESREIIKYIVKYLIMS